MLDARREGLFYNAAMMLAIKKVPIFTKEVRFFFLRFVKFSFDLDNIGQIKLNESELFCK